MNTPLSRFELIAAELASLGVTIAARPGEYSVNYRADKDETARCTDDLDEALELGRAMAASALAGVIDHAPQAEGASTPRRRKWRRPASAKVARRRFIRAHNRRMRARAIKRQDDAL
jgi:hypothetical protein